MLLNVLLVYSTRSRMHVSKIFKFDVSEVDYPVSLVRKREFCGLAILDLYERGLAGKFFRLEKLRYYEVDSNGDVIDECFFT